MFADDNLVVGFINNNYEKECQLNVIKTKQMTVDFRCTKAPH